MNVPPIYRVVTNGSHYAIQRKAGVMDEWRLCGSMVPTSDFTAERVPYTYKFRWMARWRMCRLMLEEFENQKTQEEIWTEAP